MVSRTTVANVIVDKIRHNDSNGCVIRGLIVDDNGTHSNSLVNITIPGNLTGENFRVHKGLMFCVSGQKGEYINKHTGEIEEQIKAKKIIELSPKNGNFISYITHSDIFENVGVVTATLLYKKFGNNIFKILNDKDYDQLLKVDGVTPQKAYSLIEGWHSDNKGKVVEWLDIHNLPKWIGSKLTKAYNNNSIDKITSDPYRLIAFTVDWNKIDLIAQDHFNISKDDPRRLHGAVSEVIFKLYEDSGDTAVTRDTLLDNVSALLGNELANKALSHVYTNGGFVKLGDNLYQGRGAFLQEEYLSTAIIERSYKSDELPYTNIHEILSKWESKNYELTDEQRSAVSISYSAPLSIITGGAGVGKTSVLEAFHSILDKTKGTAIQMALSGRAAKRMQEATGREAITIAGFLHKLDDQKINSATHIIIDECSMVDLYSFIRILRSIKSTQKLILVGDPSQLPPVGAGKVFHMLAEMTFIPVTKLTKVWRQNKETGIPFISQNIRDGIYTPLASYNGRKEGVSIVPATTKNIGGMIEQVYAELGGNKKRSDVRIICPTTASSDWGTLGINKHLSYIYTNKKDEVFTGEGNVTPKPTGLNIGDLVMATKNNWNKGIMNGSLGRVIRLANEKEITKAVNENILTPVIMVEFDSDQVLLDEDDLRSLQWGYSITCHKAQGSQFSRVIIPVIRDILIDRTWIYTALTRGVKQVVFIGNTKIIKKAIESEPTALLRTVGLDYHLAEHLK